MNAPEMLPTNSSNVDAIGYDADTNELHVKFRSGGHYIYSAVPPEIFDEAKSSDSIGRFMSKRIKGAFEARKMS